MLACFSSRLTKLSLILLLSLRLGSAYAQEPAKVSVCELMGDLDKWSEKLIVVSGTVTLGPEILAVNQPNCSTVPETEGIKWPSSVWLAGNPFGFPNIPADRLSLDFFGATKNLIRSMYMPDGYTTIPIEIHATFRGVLHTKKTPGVVIEAKGRKYLTGGFGHLTVFPAELEYVAVEDLVITGLSWRYPSGSQSPISK